MKKLFSAILIVLLSCGVAFAQGAKDTDTSIYVFFNDYTVSAGTYSDWSTDVRYVNGVQTQEIGKDKGWNIDDLRMDATSDRNRANITLVLAYANTTTGATANITGTYQFSSDGYTWSYPTGGNPETTSASATGNLLYDGVAPGEGSRRGDSWTESNLWTTARQTGFTPTAAYGASAPYPVTLTSVTETNIWNAKYMRVKLFNNGSTDAKVDFIGMGSKKFTDRNRN